MEEKGLTSEDMDEELELEDGEFEAILRGEVLLDADQVERISSILDMSPMRLLLLPIGWSSTSVRPSMPSLAKDSVPKPRRGHHLSGRSASIRKAASQAWLPPTSSPLGHAPQVLPSWRLAVAAGVASSCS